MDRPQAYSDTATELQQKVTATAVGEHLQKAIRDPNPDTGWEGDAFLVLTHDPDGYWRIWDTKNGAAELVAMKKADGRELDTRSLTRGLAQASMRKQTALDVLNRVQANNDFVDEQARKAMSERIAGESERIAFELGKEVG
jgi:hypothetical protein